MRKHVLALLAKETKTPFSQQAKRVKRGKEFKHCFPLYCKYWVPFVKDDPKEDKGFFMALFQFAENVKIFLWSSFVTKQ